MAKRERKKIIPTKTPMPQQPATERIHNFNEVPYGYSEADAIAEAKRCIQCPKPTCSHGCPVGIDVRGFIYFIAEGDFQGAIDKIKETNALPAITGRVCPQEDQCEGVCILANKFESVSIGRLERFVADWEAKQGELPPPKLAPATGKTIAIVGSGPAGLTAAADLAKMGHKVTIYEALHEAGGVLVYGIPEFRLPKDIVRREVEYIQRMGVELVTDFIVGSSATMEQILDDFDAVFLGTGAGLPWFMGLPGEDLNGVYSANEYLTRVNLMKAYNFPDFDTPVAEGRRAITIGGGNVAMDSARTALRMHVNESIVLYRRTRTEMPCRLEELEHAEDEGVQFEYLTAPVAFHGDENGRIVEVECIRNELGEPDASGRRRPVPIEGSNFRVPTDMVIVSIGQSPSPLIPKSTPELETGRKGEFVVNPDSMKTSMEGVFAGGDAATGGATVILAMGQAKIAAKAIDEYLKTGVW